MIESTSSLQREEEVSGAQDFLNQRNRSNGSSMY
jgi:hypothetical protein